MTAAFHPDLWTAQELRNLRQQRRELTAENPAFARKLRAMTDRELYALKAVLLEDALSELRRQPKFNKSPELQSQSRIYEHQLRELNELEIWTQYRIKHPRKSLARYRGKTVSTAAVPIANNVAFPTVGPLVVSPDAHDAVGAASPIIPELPRRPVSEPVLSNEERDNLINIQDRLFSKCFHTRRPEEDGVW